MFQQLWDQFYGPSGKTEDAAALKQPHENSKSAVGLSSSAVYKSNRPYHNSQQHQQHQQAHQSPSQKQNTEQDQQAKKTTSSRQSSSAPSSSSRPHGSSATTSHAATTATPLSRSGGSTAAGPSSSSQPRPQPPPPVSAETKTAYAFETLLLRDPIDLAELRRLSWHGCPARFRAQTWFLLTGYWSPQVATRNAIQSRKNADYNRYIAQHYNLCDWDEVCGTADGGRAPSRFGKLSRAPSHSANMDALGAAASTSASSVSGVGAGDGNATISGSSNSGGGGGAGAGSASPVYGSRAPRVSLTTAASSAEVAIIKQIRKDVPRMSAGLAYLRHPRVTLSVERILFIWSARHPACGYVQGMNDLLLPFLSVALAHEYCQSKSLEELEGLSAEELQALWAGVPEGVWVAQVEAPAYWMLAYLLNVMQDNYTRHQWGITQMMKKLECVVRAADRQLYHHLVEHLGVEVAQFTFRWMNCLLLREFTPAQGLRLFDSYLSEENKGWDRTHTYMCAALLLRWSPQLIRMTSFADALGFLQNLPTSQLGPQELDELFAEAYMLECLYDDALQHL